VRKRTVDRPVLPSPMTRTLLPASSMPPFYLNFKVLMARSASNMEMIQNRTITLGSAQPLSSK